MGFFNLFSGSMAHVSSLRDRIPYKLSESRRQGVRLRLRQVETNLQELMKAGVVVKSLEREKLVPRYSQMTTSERYTFFSTRTKSRMPIHYLPKFTKVDPPSFIRHHYEYLEIAPPLPTADKRQK